MKKTIFLLLLTVFSVSGQAQKRQPSVAGYGAAVAELTSIDKKAALNLGGYGGVLINHRFLLGASGNNILFSKTINGSKTDFQFNYYGLITEYKFFPGSFVHFSAGLTSALGWLENDILTADKKKRMDGDYVYVIQPVWHWNFVSLHLCRGNCMATTALPEIQRAGTSRPGI